MAGNQLEADRLTCLFNGSGTGKLLVNMKTKISFLCPFPLVFYSFLYREGTEMGGPDGDGMFACGSGSHKLYKICRLIFREKNIHVYLFERMDQGKC